VVWSPPTNSLPFVAETSPLAALDRFRVQNIRLVVYTWLLNVVYLQYKLNKNIQQWRTEMQFPTIG
jgi:hypothetical protein